MPAFICEVLKNRSDNTLNYYTTSKLSRAKSPARLHHQNIQVK